jgi:uncharacterized protein (TIGR02678 family)
MSGDPQVAIDRRVAARHLIQRPLTCAEHDPDTFRLIRRHEAELDRWFTQRLGYRLHVDADTARLFKSGVLLEHHPLQTSSGRPLHQLEHVLLALVLASTAAGPSIISLRDLVDEVRSAAAEADITLSGDATERRALVAVLKWMIDRGLAVELHAHVDAYAADDAADAVLKVRPDRIALVPLPDLVAAADRQELLDRADRRSTTRQWVRGRLVEDPVVYRDDLTDAEWAEMRRRLGEEERILDEMFGLVLEARAEGMAAIDPGGALSARRFPAGGTLGHAALLLIDAMRDEPAVPLPRVHEIVGELTREHAGRWANDMVRAPDRLARDVIDVLVELRLAVVYASEDEPWFRLLPGAARFRPDAPADTGAQQESLW